MPNDPVLSNNPPGTYPFKPKKKKAKPKVAPKPAAAKPAPAKPAPKPGAPPPKGAPPPPAGGGSFEQALADAQRDLANGTFAAEDDSNDPDVYAGGYWKTSRDATAFTKNRREWVADPGKTKKLSQLQDDFYRLSPGELRRFQDMAFQAGMYGKSADREDVPFGTYDEDSFKIWSTLGARSASFLRAGKRVTVWDALTDSVSNKAPGTGTDGSSERERTPLTVELANPEDIRSIAEDKATEILGRRARPDEVAQMVNIYQGMQRAAQERAYAATGSGMPGGPGGEIVAPPSVAAFAERRLREQNPQEAAEVGYMDRYEQFQSMLRGAGL